METTEITSILLAVFAMLTVIVLMILLKHIKELGFTLAKFSNKTPDTSIVSKVATTSEALESSLIAHKQSLESFPSLVSGRVSAEVKEGINPFKESMDDLGNRVEKTIHHLAESLSNTHNKFEQALHTLNTDGELTDWIESLRKTVEPLRHVSTSLTHHYETNAKVLESSHELVVQLAGLKEAAEASFSSIDGVIKHWEAKEELHIRNTENRILSRLEEVQKSNEEVTYALSGLQTSQKEMSDTQTGLSQSMGDAKDSFTSLSEMNSAIQGQIKTLLDEHSQFKDRLHQWQTTIITDSSNVQDSLKRFVADYQKSISEIDSKMHEIVNSSSTMLNSFHKVHIKALKDFKQQHQNMSTSQANMASEQQKMMKDMQNIVWQLPNKGLQITVVVMLTMQLILMMVLIFKS